MQEAKEQPKEEQIGEEIEEEEYEYEYYYDEEDPSKSGNKISLSGSTKTKQYLQFQMAEREKERNSPGKGGDASSQRSLFQHSKQDKIDALKDAKAELKIGAEQLLQEQMAKHLMMNAGANVRRTDEFGFQAADQTVDKQIMKIKRLDLSKLNTAI